MRFFAGKLVFSGLAVALFAKAATSLPLTPAPPSLPEPVGSDLFVLAATEGEGEVIAEAEDAPPSVMFGEDGASFPTCEVPEQVLQSLQDERELLDQQRRALASRESQVALAEEKLAIEKTTLKELKGSIEDLMNKIEGQQTDDLDRLISLYQNMKPTDAANIMNDMDIDVMIMVLGKMSPRVAAPIMAKMSPVRARAVSKIILERSKLPGDQNLNGLSFN